MVGSAASTSTRTRCVAGHRLSHCHDSPPEPRQGAELTPGGQVRACVDMADQITMMVIDHRNDGWEALSIPSCQEIIIVIQVAGTLSTWRCGCSTCSPRFASPNDTAFSVDEVARETGLSLTYLRNMLAGRQDNPSRKVIAALANFFEVSPAYFFHATDEANAACAKPASEIEVALRAAERLGPEGRQILLDMIRLAQRIAERCSPEA